ncbi:MAG: hypothetical protein RDA78_01985 [Roseibium sp.]|uniref:hypothetical protein n=1 Tax=Roseibium sp. TaxID=1936156 RepID=UPI003D9C3E92
MQGDTARIALFGTVDRADTARRVAVGDLSFLIDGDAIRCMSWKGVEVIRALSWPARDENWITLPQIVRSSSLDANEHEALLRLEFEVAEGALSCLLTVAFSAAGSVEADLTMNAKRDFDTNRTGFTLLHPIEGVAGESLAIVHSDGSRQQTKFPRFISPSQPAFDISGLSYALNGTAVDIAFDGEIFEMEDQRNWTDASFKTYCRPLVFPFTYRIGGGETVRQSIRISFSGDGPGAASSDTARVTFEPDGTMPKIALAAEPGWLPVIDRRRALEKTGIGAIQVRVGPSIDTAFLEQAARTSRHLETEFDLEVVVPEGTDPQVHFSQIRALLDGLGIEPVRVLSVAEPYLKSHQPTGPWPDGPRPDDCVKAARKVFGSALIGGGALTNFTEFNRCPPRPELCDFIGHGMTAIVHAADDRSVCETIEALSHVFESAINMAAGRPYRLSLATIGMRSNPYGADVAENPGQVRQTMARFDPRQQGIFAAAFAVGVLNATQGYPVESLALAAPAGPFGIIAQKLPVESAYFDAHTDALVYPIFHVVRMAARMGSRQRQGVHGLPRGLRAVAAGTRSDWDMMIANLGDRSASVRLPSSAGVRRLDPSSFDEAVRDPDWLTNAKPVHTDECEVEPYTVLFASAAGARA